MADAPIAGRCRQPIDERALFTYLARTAPGVVPRRATACFAEQFSHGQSNPTYKINFCDARHGVLASVVLRKKPPGTLLKSAHAIEREYEVMNALATTSVPTPKMVCLCEDVSVLGEAFYVMSFVDGAIYTVPSLPNCGPNRRREIYRAMAQTLGALHAVLPVNVGLTSYGRAERYSARQVERWSAQYEASVGERVGVAPEESMRALISWLAANVPEQELSGRLVHGDFRLDNLVIKRGRGADDAKVEVLAVLDWELSTVGAPYADVAFNCLPYYLPSAAVGDDLYPTLNPSALPDGIPNEREYVQWWSEASGIANPMTRMRSATWPFYVAFSLFRGASILAGVRARAVQGNASSANAHAMGKLVDVFAKRALVVIRGVDVPRGVQELSETRREDLIGNTATGFEPSPKAAAMLLKLKHFMRAHVYKAEEALEAHAETSERWSVHSTVEELKAKAKLAGLWNLWLPMDSAALLKIQDTSGSSLFAGPRLTNLEYAHLAQEMGRSVWASEAFNCSAPDTGNMEVLLRYGSAAQQDKWLRPLLLGEIRSCFAMTEPAVASSDATNIESAIVREGNDYVLNGRKWWTSGACDPRCKLIIFMGKTARDDSGVPIHKQQSMVLCSMDAPGVRVVRPLTVFGYDDAPHGHAEVTFTNVRVGADESILLGEGRGFEIAQGRLGPGRLHHCMRLIGMGERSLELAASRATSRVAFGKPLASNGNVLQRLGQCRVTLDGARLLTLQAAHMLDKQGIKVARGAVAACKVAAPAAALSVIDAAIQIHGGMGVSQDTPLARLYAGARTLRLADGPDEVHLETIAKMEVRRSKL